MPSLDMLGVEIILTQYRIAIRTRRINNVGLRGSRGDRIAFMKYHTLATEMGNQKPHGPRYDLLRRERSRWGRSASPRGPAGRFTAGLAHSTLQYSNKSATLQPFHGVIRWKASSCS